MSMQSHYGPFTVEFLGTPEAGRTSAIKKTRKELSKITNVRVLQEAVTTIPDIFETQEYKKSMESHFWMRLTMVAKLLELQCSGKSNDILLVDRGLIDSFCWNYYFAEKGEIPNEVALRYHSLMQNILNFPDLVIYLKTTPEEAVRRHGGEGEIVTSRFISDFEKAINTFLRFPPLRAYTNDPVPVFTLDTTGFDKEEISKIVYSKIISEYNKSKNFT